jgi:hypothetical protein
MGINIITIIIVTIEEKKRHSNPDFEDLSHVGVLLKDS